MFLKVTKFIQNSVIMVTLQFLKFENKGVKLRVVYKIYKYMNEL